MPHEFSIVSDAGWVPGMQVAFKFDVQSGEDWAAMGVKAMQIMEQLRAKQDLLEAMVEIQARTETIERYDELVTGCIESRTRERTKLLASFEAQDKIRHMRNPRRGEWQPSTAEQQQLATFDLETRDKLEALRLEKENCEKELPLYEPRLQRARMILAGKDRAEVIELKVVAEAAD